MIRFLFLLALAFALQPASAQSRYFTKTAKINFTSKAPLEDIEAKNKTGLAVLDAKSGALQFSVQMKSFEFEKALMQEHFNENYVESDKFPKAEFKGVVTNNGTVNYAKDGSYPVKVKGKLTLHGITRDVETTGVVKVTGGQLDATSSFTIKLSDYNISIPAVVKDKVATTIRITVDARLEPLKT